MVFELHVWGPAFGLPSIDPQCISMVAYFALAVPMKLRGSDGERERWVLVADSDPGMVPTNELPALWTGTRWISRFRNIVAYLSQYSDGEWDLDRWMGQKEKADCIAFSSFLESQGQPLIDLSLYVSSDNYNNATSQAYASFLQWPSQWITPPQIRKLAKKRTEHLSLTSLDLDVMAEEQRHQARDPSSLASKIPKSLIRKRQATVSDILNRSSKQNQIRLEGMASAFVAPLEERLGRKGYLLSSEIPSSQDCLALGYLSLALVPNLPNPWLRDAVTEHGPQLVAYVARLRSRCFGDVPVEVFMAFSESVGGASSLPWRAPELVSLGAMGKRALEGVADSIPIVQQIRANARLQRACEQAQGPCEEKEIAAKVATMQRRELYTSIATVLAGLGMFVGYVLYAGFFQVEQAAEVEEDEDEEGEEEEDEEGEGEEEKKADYPKSKLQNPAQEEPAGDTQKPMSPLGEAGSMLGI
ncbi:metaxin [Histoplasma ohiense]|nr:metaxin [Histoplasma ohiense (nom. inval.)]